MPRRRTVDLRGPAHPLLDVVSYGRGGRLDRIQLEQIARTVRRVPEVMVKVTGGGRSVDAVVEHLGYIGKRGKLEIETEDGQRVEGRGRERQLVNDWELALDANEIRWGRSGRKSPKLVHQVMFSMPRGISPEKLLKAVRGFAREQFAGHRYAMVLHSHQENPHVHLVVKAISEDGKRLNIYKATLRQWRREFAWQLRAHGIDANATERAERGISKKSPKDAIYRAARHGRPSVHLRRRVESVAAEMAAGGLRSEPGKVRLLATRQAVRTGWRAVCERLRGQNEDKLASELERFVAQMPPPKTEREQLAEALRTRIKPPPTR